MDRGVFHKFDSIENYNAKLLKELWVAEEKLHGANFSFVTDGENIAHARRKGFIAPGEKFLNYNTEMVKYHKYVLNVFKQVKELTGAIEVKRVQVFGEYIGGQYNHPDVKPNKDVCRVQKEIQYTPDHLFVPFDVSYFLPGEDWPHAISYFEMRKILEAAGFPLLLTPLATGSREHVTCVPVNNVVTEIPAKLGLPAIENNFMEGIIIRRVSPKWFPRRHSIFKIKSNAFKDARKNPEKIGKKQKAAVDIPAEVVSRITLPRATSATSKFGSFTKRDQVRTIALSMVDDIVDEIRREKQLPDYTLTEKQRKTTLRLCNDLVHKNFDDLVHV